MTSRGAGAVALLTGAVLVLAACGGGRGGDVAVPVVPEPAPSATTTVTITPTPVPGGKPGKSPKPGTSATPGATAGGTTPGKPKPVRTPLPPIQNAMPDGRTSPVAADFTISNLKLDNRFLAATIATVDVTYSGPGFAGMSFTATVTYTANGKGALGKSGKATTTYNGEVTSMRAGVTQSVRLAGGDQKLYMADGSPYSAKYTISSVTDEDPKARAQ
jgi:hypothetical protein